MIDTPDYPFSQKQTTAKNKLPCESKQKRRKIFYRVLIYTILVSVGGCLSYAWYFLTEKFVQEIEKPVSDYLGMDVNLGEINTISGYAIKLGKSTIRTREGDNDYVEAKSVEISLNPQDLWQKKIALTINVIKPDGYLQQNDDRSWLNLNLNSNLSPQFFGFILTVNEIKVTDCKLGIQGEKNGKLLDLQETIIPDGQIKFENRRSVFNVKGGLVNGGNFQLEGINHYQQNQWLITVKGKQLPTDTLTKLNLVDLPITMSEGKLNGDLTLQFDNSRLTDVDGFFDLAHINLNLPLVSPQLTNTNGKVLFDNQTITLVDLNTDFGLIPAEVNGLINYHQQTLNLNIQTEEINIGDGIKTFNLPQPVIKTEGKIKSQVSVTGSLSQPLVTAVINNTDTLTIDKLTANQGKAKLTVFNSQLKIDELNLLPDIGGKVTGKGEVSLIDSQPTFNLNLKVEGLDGNKLANVYQQELPIQTGFLTGEYQISGNWRNLPQTKLTGITEFPVADGEVKIHNLSIANNQWQGEVNLEGIHLQQLSSSLINCQHLGCQDSRLNGKFKLNGKLDNLSLPTINLIGDASINFAEGIVNFQQIQLSQGIWQTLVIADNLTIDKLPFLSPSLLTNSESNLDVDSSVVIRNVSSLDSGFLHDLKKGKIATRLEVKGNLAYPHHLKVDGIGKIDLALGDIDINNFSLVNNELIANFSTNKFNLDSLSDKLRGEAKGEITVKGNIDNLTLPNLQVEGEINFSQGIGLIQQPLFTSFNYDGNQIHLDKVETDNISGKGIINYDFNNQAVKEVNLEIKAREIDLQQIPLPSQLDLLSIIGKVNFQGNLVGDFSQPHLTGEIRLHNFSIANLTLSSLTGNLNFSHQQGVNLNLASMNPQTKDKLQLKLDSNYQPQSIFLQTQQTQLTANRQQDNQDNLEIALTNLPLTSLTQLYLDNQSSLTHNQNKNNQDKNNQSKNNQDKNNQGKNNQQSKKELTQTDKNIGEGEDVETNKKKAESIVVDNSNSSDKDKDKDSWLVTSQRNDNHSHKIKSQIESIDGNLSAKVILNLDTYEINNSEIEIHNPSINHFQGDLLTATISSQQQHYQLTEGMLIEGENEYNFTAELQLNSDNPQFKGELIIDDGDIQQILTSLQIFELSDIPLIGKPRSYDKAEDLYEETKTAKQNNSNLTNNSDSELKDEMVSFFSHLVNQNNDNNVNQDLKTEKNNPHDSELMSEITTSQRNDSHSHNNPSSLTTSDSQRKKESQPHLNHDNQDLNTEKNNPHNSELMLETTTSQRNDSHSQNNSSSLTTSDSQRKRESQPHLNHGNQDLNTEKNNPHNSELMSETTTSQRNDSHSQNNSSSLTTSDSQRKRESQPHHVNNADVDSPVVTRNVSNADVDSPVVTRNVSNLQNEFPSNQLSVKQPLAEIGKENQSLLESIKLWQEIEKKMKETKSQSESNSPLPPLENLEGKFKGKINLAFTPQTGINTEFSFQGNDWQWGNYQANLLQLKGSYQNGLLTILPILIQQDNSQISLTGTFQPERISGQIRVENLPITEINQDNLLFENLNLDGKINANIVISGNQEYPLAKGNISFDDLTINSKNIDSIRANFDYRQSKVTIFANSNLQENEQILTIIGNMPFQLFDNSIKPEIDQFNFNLSMNQGGFNLLDIMTNNQVNWMEGDGDINLDITGSYEQKKNKINNLQTQGIININNGIINAQFLPEKPLTHINGKILFDFDQLTIPNLSGEFSEGKIIINGSLPLTEDKFNQDSLNINLEDISLNLDSLYQGNAQGKVMLKGKVIKPEISGQIELFNGEINLNNNLANSQNLDNSNNSWLGETQINNFNLILGKNVSINQIPILSLKAQGNINFNGEIRELKTDGLINLKSGKINFFTSQLKLIESYQNIVKLNSENLLNPYLDLELEGSVTETSRHQFLSNSNPNEVSDLSSFSVTTAQTIRVKAKVKGLSDNLENNLEFSSSPPRSEAEIIALLGGGFFNNFMAGDQNLGLANLASAAFLGSFQGELGEALGFDEFRFFPAQILDPEKRTATLGFGAEIGINLTDDFSVSIFKILTNDQQPQYNLRYRINEQLNIKGSSDFNQDSRGVIEFQHRF